MLKMLIIEDNENIKKELIDFLSKYGYEAYGIDDFKNIINLSVESNPDLILL